MGRAHGRYNVSRGLSDVGIAGPAGIRYGPTCNGKVYLSLFNHRGRRPNKSCWAVTPNEEYVLFCTADREDWRDGNGHYWGMGDRALETVGTKGEKLCKFPKPSNAHDPWHGYPVSPYANGDADRPPSAIIEHWYGTGMISRTSKAKIYSNRI